MKTRSAGGRVTRARTRASKENRFARLELLPEEVLIRILELALFSVRDEPEKRLRQRTSLGFVCRALREAATTIDEDVITVINTASCCFFKTALEAGVRPRRYELLCHVLLQESGGAGELAMPNGTLYSRFIKLLPRRLQDVRSLHLRVEGFEGEGRKMTHLPEIHATQISKELLENRLDSLRGDTLIEVSAKLFNEDAQLDILLQWLHRFPALKALRLYPWGQRSPLHKTTKFINAFALSKRQPSFVLERLRMDRAICTDRVDLGLPARRVFLSFLFVHNALESIDCRLVEELSCAHLQGKDAHLIIKSLPRLRVLRLGRTDRVDNTILGADFLEAVPKIIDSLPKGSYLELAPVSDEWKARFAAACAERSIELGWHNFAIESITDAHSGCPLDDNEAATRDWLEDTKTWLRR